ncbi:Spo0E family sporulation regulatory protein-aspartic acid phosphatase [Brevibacillus sp. SAFN-007a]|uniref:Spo0E family sporulation regulatory protein-aspartic acid phosphatase n=1 Tax=Brevibacillus sp. SAFN-007a TaxID=3436862 RepID=UPI003F7EABC6
MDEEKITLTIEQLRQQLSQMVKEKGFSDAAVIALSQKLDIYIVQYQQRYPEGK